MPNLTDLESAVARLERELAEAKNALDVAKRSYFAEGDLYLFISGNGGISERNWGDNKTDRERLELGNVFRTREQAEGELRYRKIMAKLRKLARQSGDIGVYAWSIFKNDGDFEVWDNTTGVADIGVVLFATRESALSAIAEIGEDDLNFVRDWL